MQELIPLVIDRTKWARGGKGGTPGLLNTSGNMCCLGFLGMACGFPASALDAGTPRGVMYTDQAKWPKTVLDEDLNNTPWTKTAIGINDNLELRSDNREGLLITHFQGIGYDLTFEGARDGVVG